MTRSSALREKQRKAESRRRGLLPMPWHYDPPGTDAKLLPLVVAAAFPAPLPHWSDGVCANIAAITRRRSW